MAVNITDQEWRKLREKVEVLNGDRGDAQKTMRAVRYKDFLTLTTSLSSTSSGVSSLNQSISDLQTQINSIKNDGTSNSSDITTIKAQIATLMADDDSQQGEIAALQTWKATATGQISALQTGLTATNTAATALATRVTNLESAQTAANGVTLDDVTSADVTDAPTAADFNALRADVIALRTTVEQLIEAFAPPP